MNSVLSLTTLLAAVCLSMAASPEYVGKVIGSLKYCSDKSDPKVEMKEVLEIVKANQLPTTQEMKCVMGCFVEKMGYVTDMKIDWNKVKALNPQKYDSKEDVEKANTVVDNCAKVVTEKASNTCDLGVPALQCLYDESAKLQLAKPVIKLEE